MDDKQAFYKMFSQIDDVHSVLAEAVDAMQILDDFMEEEGFMHERNFEEWRAINFSKRFPLYLNTFRVILRDIVRAKDELHAAINVLYAAIGVQN